MYLRAVQIFVVAALANGCDLAIGATKTTNLAVSASVASNCMINLTSTMAFGIYSPGAGNIDRTSTIAVRCTRNTPYGIGLSAGTGAGSTIAQRRLSSATAVGRLQYNLYTTNARNVVWNNRAVARATGTTQGGTGTGVVNVINHTVYGRLQDSATSQAARPASDFTSTITVTLTY